MNSKDLSKKNQVKEISDVRDETGIDGLKITIDLKRGADPEKLMQKLFRPKIAKVSMVF